MRIQNNKTWDLSDNCSWFKPNCRFSDHNEETVVLESESGPTIKDIAHSESLRQLEKNKEIETTMQQFNELETICKTLVKVIDDKNDLDILDQKVFEETKSLVLSVYKAVYKEDMPYQS